LIEQQQRVESQLEQLPASPQRTALTGEALRLRHEIDAVYQQHSLLGRLGRAIEPAVRPLGWDWRIGCAVLASFPAREIVVATLGVVYGVGRAWTSSRTTAPATAGETPQCHMGRHGQAGVYLARGTVDHGVLRTMRAVRRHVGRDSARNEQLALASLHLRLHDGAGLCRGADHLPGWDMALVGWTSWSTVRMDYGLRMADSRRLP